MTIKIIAITLLVGLAALPSMSIRSANAIANVKVEEQQVTLVVTADSALGSKFKNGGKQPFMMEIFTNGKWTVGPNSGWCGATGYSEAHKAGVGYRAECSFRCINCPTGKR